MARKAFEHVLRDLKQDATDQKNEKAANRYLDIDLSYCRSCNGTRKAKLDSAAETE